MSAPDTTNATTALPLTRGKRIAFSLVLLVFLAIFAEASLQIFYRLSVGRWLWQWWALPIYASDPHRVYRLKSGLDYTHRTREFTARYQTDANGWRTDGTTLSPTLAKPDDALRILALGPSFTFGWGVNYEDAFIHQIVKGLRVPGKRIELINLGTPSQPISMQLKWLRETGYVYQPDLIVQIVYGEVDKLESDERLPATLPTVKDGYLVSGNETWKKKIRLWSATLFYGWHVYNWLIGAPAMRTGDGRELYRSDNTASAEDCLDRYRNYSEFVRRAVTNQPEVVFLHVPLSYVVRPADITRSSAPLDPQHIRTRTAGLARLLQTNGVNFINPLPALVERDAKERTYYLYDIHFTPAGNQVVAEFASPKLQEIVNRIAATKR